MNHRKSGFALSLLTIAAAIPLLVSCQLGPQTDEAQGTSESGNSVQLSSKAIAAAPVIDPAFPKVVNGSSFKVRVTATGAPYTGSHLMLVTMTAPNGFSPKVSSQSIAHLNSGATKVLEFTLRAPNYSTSGFLLVEMKWSSLYSGRGTYISSQSSASIGCNAGWTVSAQLLHPGGLLQGDPTVWALTNSWRYSQAASSKTPPYYVTFTVPGVSATYTLGATWWLYVPKIGPVPKGKEITVSVTRSGQVFTF